jgi:hypothetical protein
MVTQMTFSLVRAIRSTHKHPVNRILHCIGLLVYATGIMLIVGYFIGLHATRYWNHSVVNGNWYVLDWT